MVDFSANRGSRVKLESLGGYRRASGVDQQTGDYCSDQDNRGGDAMSLTQTLIGGGVFVAVGSALLQMVLPAPAPITVHSLAFENGFVIQDRTVATSDPFYASWAAQVVDNETGEKLPWCFGSGSFAYKPGRRGVSLELSEWVGNPACTVESLPPGTYRLTAAWHWGESQAGAESKPFEVSE